MSRMTYTCVTIMKKYIRRRLSFRDMFRAAIALNDRLLLRLSSSARPGRFFSFCCVLGGPRVGFGGPGGGFLLNSLSSGFATTFTTIQKATARTTKNHPQDRPKQNNEKNKAKCTSRTAFSAVPARNLFSTFRTLTNSSLHSFFSFLGSQWSMHIYI